MVEIWIGIGIWCLLGFIPQVFILWFDPPRQYTVNDLLFSLTLIWLGPINVIITFAFFLSDSGMGYGSKVLWKRKDMR